ncbi:MAG: hypothetical protein JWM88_264 [Verrucomicrobia bacterium]|nr:hypothetical protein [Verrucomicrobiota bacterium]
MMIKPPTFALINFPPGLDQTVSAASQLAFPGARLMALAALESPGQSNGSAPDLIVLCEPDAALAAAATQAVDPTGAPRWAVVILGRETSDVTESVPPEDWNARALARIFQTAWRQHDLLRENYRLRGDLKTVARRISHDLRTPAGCIHTSSDLLDELTIGKSAALTNVADIFRQSSGEISHIVDRVSFVLRASAEPVGPAPVDMGAIVKAVIVQLEAEIRASNASVVQPDSWPAVRGVAPWLQMVWLNLLQNALRHGGPAPQVRIAWAREGETCRFSVSDRGGGVLAAREPGLFLPFDQLHALRYPGLGLSIVQRLVLLQGGRCGYEKMPEGGAGFHFTLPLA